MPRRGRLPAKYIQVLTLLAPCQGYELGKTIGEIADAIYDRHDFQSKAKARQLIGAARRATRRQGINADIFSIKLVGTSERRYCHLTTVSEYTKAINDFQTHIEGTQETEEELERRRETVEARARLEEARRARARARTSRQQT
ncbi:hypothetical protein KAW11_04185 [Candidatus Bathyarchaeota archaeon]|nr:hypothetical protein [Candidatus Bathyarchaeota archaeon]